MNRWKLMFGTMAAAAVLAMTGCGGGGGLSQTIANEYRMYAVAQSGAMGLYRVNSSGVVTQLWTGNSASQFRSVAPGRNKGEVYVSSNSTDSIVLARFINDLPGPSNGVAVAENSGSLLYKHPTKNVLYALVPTNDIVEQWAMNVDGTLTPLVNQILATDDDPVDMVFHPSGNYAYILSKGNGIIRTYAVAANGALSFVNGGSLLAGSQPTSIEITDDGNNVYVMSATQNIAQFSVNGNGTLAPLGTPSAQYPMGNFRAAITNNNVLSFYREADEGIETFGRTGGGLLADKGAANFATTGTTDVHRLPGLNLLLLIRRGNGATQTVAVDSSGTMSQTSTSSVIANPSGVAFWKHN